MRQGEAAFVDSGAWIALALSRDALRARAREQWDLLEGAGAKLPHLRSGRDRNIHLSRSQRQPGRGVDVERSHLWDRSHKNSSLELRDLVAKAAEATLAAQHYVSPVDVLMGIGWLDPERELGSE